MTANFICSRSSGTQTFLREGKALWSLCTSFALVTEIGIHIFLWPGVDKEYIVNHCGFNKHVLSINHTSQIHSRSLNLLWLSSPTKDADDDNEKYDE